MMRRCRRRAKLTDLQPNLFVELLDLGGWVVLAGRAAVRRSARRLRLLVLHLHHGGRGMMVGSHC